MSVRGDFNTDEALLHDCINTVIGFEELAEVFDKSNKASGACSGRKDIHRRVIYGRALHSEGTGPSVAERIRR